MSAGDPQILYMILIVPCLFGLTLVGEGINKLAREETGGTASVIFGILFVGLVVFTYFFFSDFLVVNAGI